MRLLTLAAGIATGYVIGTRAGRDKYEQIVDSAKQFRANPTAGQALTALQGLVSPGPRSAGAGPASGAVVEAPATVVVEEPVVAVVADVPTQPAGTVQRPRRAGSTATGSGVPLA